MSTAEREVMDAGVAHHPSTSLVLVPLAADRHVMVDGWAVPRPAPRVEAHLFFYGLGYAGLGLMVVGVWVSARSEEVALGFFGLGVGCVGLGGLGVLVHLLWKPRTLHKLRTTLGAIASLVLTIATLPPTMNVAREVRASGLVPAAQEIVDRAEPRTTTGELARAGFASVDFAPGYVLLRAEGAQGWWMLHARPGHPLPSRGSAVAGLRGWRTEPLGGGWYILIGD